MPHTRENALPLCNKMLRRISHWEGEIIGMVPQQAYSAFGKEEGGEIPKLQRWLHEEVQITGVGRLLWFFASCLRSCPPN